MIAIHEVHRRLARVTEMTLQKDGSLVMDQAEMKLLVSLLKENLMLICKLDGLKDLAFHAYEMGDMEWHAEICLKLDELEAQMI
ncbi:hypothetical protein [Bacillus sp. 3255]|uniref:DUF7667 family protein n=1 Tax=Bacillus sp. 3255 TaxID=2817904 RepID=UPI00285FFFC5|nr:hypothetical protein [Bacillus sp. 3255]MDR6884870.1 hypothetical protein [Bacillus sp. 3255]